MTTARYRVPWYAAVRIRLHATVGAWLPDDILKVAPHIMPPPVQHQDIEQLVADYLESAGDALVAKSSSSSSSSGGGGGEDQFKTFSFETMEIMVLFQAATGNAYAIAGPPHSSFQRSRLFLQTISAPANASKLSARFLAKYLTVFAVEKNPTALEQLREQIEETRGILHNNMQVMLQRQERLESLDEHTDDLVDASKQFEHNGRQVRRSLCCQNVKLTACIVCLFVLVFLLLFGGGGSLLIWFFTSATPTPTT